MKINKRKNTDIFHTYFKYKYVLTANWTVLWRELNKRSVSVSGARSTSCTMLSLPPYQEAVLAKAGSCISMQQFHAQVLLFDFLCYKVRSEQSKWETKEKIYLSLLLFKELRINL